MRWGWAALIAAVGFGCGAVTTAPMVSAPEMSEDGLARAVQELVAASATHDAATIAKRLDEDVGYGGLWFADTTCRRTFAVTGTVHRANVPVLAGCIAPLTLVKSTRGHPYANAAVFTYEPGLEIEVMFDQETSRVRWMGYAGRRGARDALPTVTQEALEALRADTAVVALDPATVAALTDDGKTHLPSFPGPWTFGAWLKVCVDATGAVTGVHAHAATTLKARDAYVALAKGWSFQPFMLGGQPSPVCAMVKLIDPAPATPPASLTLPEPVPESHADAIVIGSFELERIEGSGWAKPTPDESAAMRSVGSPRLDALLTYCVAPDGTVDWVQMTRSTGYKTFDARVTSAVSRWKFKPIAADVCALIELRFKF